MSQPWFYKWAGGHTSQKNWVRVWGPLPKTLSLFRPKSVIFPYFYVIWPKIRYPTFDRCGRHSCRKYNLWRTFVDGLTVQFKTRVQNHTLFMIKMAKIDSPFMTKTAKKTIPFGSRPYERVLPRANGSVAVLNTLWEHGVVSFVVGVKCVWRL